MTAPQTGTDYPGTGQQAATAAPPAGGIIPLCVPELGGREWEYVKECLDTNWVSSVGPFVERFERLVASFVGARHAVATVNGTAAIHAALLVAGVRPDDEVLVSTLTFVAPANAIRYVGAWPVFIDAEPEYWQIDPQGIAEFIERECEWTRGKLRNKSTHRRVSAILPVHILGHPCAVGDILGIARKYDLRVVEDATESLGARYQGQMVGTQGDLGCFSFNGNKTITTGGGGMIVTNDERLARRARYLTTQARDDPVEYRHGEVGYNYRLTNVQAAIGCAQMEHLDNYVAAKRRIAGVYRRALADMPGIALMQEAPWAFSAAWMSTVLVSPERYGMGSRSLLSRLEEAGIQTRPLWEPLHRSRAHRKCGVRRCPVADRLHQQGLCLPSSVSLTPDQQSRVVAEIGRHARRVAG